MSETLHSPPTPESAEKKKGFADLLQTLGRVVDNHVVIDRLQGKKRDVADIMKDVLTITEAKLEAAKAKRQG